MEVQHEADAHRFVIRTEGVEAEVTYTLRDGVMTINHTGVPRAIGGRGIAGELVGAAFDHARAKGLRVRPLCSYAAAWSKRHPEVADLLA
ncbi:MAG: N-acetyltransferase [Lysobacter sp.]|nr:MAG: N-acetyltransferase [Lysobacter sp.]